MYEIKFYLYSLENKYRQDMKIIVMVIANENHEMKRKTKDEQIKERNLIF